MADINSIFIPKRISALLRNIYRDKVTVICAPDGSGKSTLLRGFTSRTRPDGTSVRFITDADSTGSCFAQICSHIFGKEYSEPVTDRESLTLRQQFEKTYRKNRLLLVVDCDYSQDTLLGNQRTARLLKECSCANFVFLCSSINQYHQKLSEQLGFTLLDRSDISLTREETLEYARRCNIRVNIDEVFRECEGGFLGTRLCFMLAAQGQNFCGLTSVGRLFHAVLLNHSARMHGAISIASAFGSVTGEFCCDLRSFNPIAEYFGADLLNADAIFDELVKLRREIPLLDLDLRRRSVRFHPILRQAIYRIFQTFPDSVQHDMRICFGREFRREQKDYYAFCEFFMAGEYELASQIHNNERITYSLLIKSQGMLRNFITNCPLTCKPAVPRLLRISAMLMHTDLKPVARERFAEIIRFINSSPDYSPSDRRELLSYAYALRANEDFYVLDKMGASIKRAYDLFKGRCEYESPLFAWTMYSPTVFFLIHRRGYSIHTETAQFTRYQHMYTEMLDHGRFTEIIFAGEAKYAQGDLHGALELLSAAASLCTGTNRVATRLTAMYCAAKCCLYLGDHARFFEYVRAILRTERQYSSREESRCARLIIGLLRTLRGGDHDDIWYAICAEESDPIMNRFTAPYYSMVRAGFLISVGNYESLAEIVPDYLDTAAASGNEAAEIKLRLLGAKALAAVGRWESAVKYAAEALEYARTDGLTSMPAEFHALFPDLLPQIKSLLPQEIQPFADDVMSLSREFLRGVETVRTYEMTYFSNTREDNFAEHYLVPLKRLVASTDSLRQELGLSEMAYSYAIMAVSGVSNKEMSRLFGASCDSIKSSLKRTYSLLGVKNRRGLIGKIPTLK